MKDNEFITISLTCKNNEKCVYDGKSSDFPVVVHFTNRYSNEVEIPLAFISKRGPGIELMDKKTKQTITLRPNIADTALLDKMTAIPPRGEVSFDWVLFRNELLQFGAKFDLIGKVGSAMTIRVDGKSQEFRGVGEFRIVSD